MRAAVTNTPGSLFLVLMWESLARTFTLTWLVLTSCR